MTKQSEQFEYYEMPVFLSDTELKNAASGTDHRRYALLKRAVARGDLIHLRRGLYCLSERYRRSAPNLHVVAQRVYGPSYVSFESALSWHGWIPEAVRTVTSACMRRSRIFETPLGAFSFTRIPARVFFAHVERVVSGPDVFYMARPWRAIADYVYASGKDWRGIHPLIESLRIDEAELRMATREELEGVDRSCGHGRVSRFIRGAIKDLKL